MSKGQAAKEAMTREELEKLAERVFGDKRIGDEWLNQPNLATDNLRPIDLLSTPEGYDRVTNLLLRIEYGVLA
jgi:putative toxin-antitoxin system antitoxin component (TIGR02293 family)